jgi:hypothetical protein
MSFVRKLALPVASLMMLVGFSVIGVASTAGAAGTTHKANLNGDPTGTAIETKLKVKISCNGAAATIKVKNFSIAASDGYSMYQTGPGWSLIVVFNHSGTEVIVPVAQNSSTTLFDGSTTASLKPGECASGVPVDGLQWNHTGVGLADYISEGTLK